MIARDKPGNTVEITVREPSFDIKPLLKKHRYWHNDDPVSTHFLNALQTAFPESEVFFIEGVRDAVDTLGEENLPESQRQNIKKFIRQEALHGKHHRALNDALVEIGYTKIADFDAQMVKARKRTRKKFSVKFRLALVSAAEHFTAAMSHYSLLKNTRFIGDAKEPIQSLFFYHTIEEIEHKSVAYDLYLQMGGGYWMRVLGFVLSMLDLMIGARHRHRYLLKEDGLWNPKIRFRTFWYVWGIGGVAWGFLPLMMRYIKPGFHPWDVDEREEVNQRYGQQLELLGKM